MAVSAVNGQSDPSKALAERVGTLVSQGRLIEAEIEAKAWAAARPSDRGAWQWLARSRELQANHRGVVDASEQSSRAGHSDSGLYLAAIRSLIALGEYGQAEVGLRALELSASTNVSLLQRIADGFVQIGDHESAERCQNRCLELNPKNPALHYNHATSLIALGQIKEAEQVFDTVIALAPGDGDAYYNRATLRRQTSEHNHIAEIENRLANTAETEPEFVPLAYALAKELEDLREYEKSFRALRKGAESRRRRLSYKVEEDCATMAQIQEVFDADWMKSANASECGASSVFVLGLPRTGSTLVDRILSSHSQITSLGEIHDLALSLMAGAGEAPTKSDLIAHASRLDPRALGATYEQRCRAYGRPEPFFIDKTPSNFLYIGLIAAALPEATIIHVRRNPIDTCYAIYKTLFRMGYPYSYNLEDIARYYAAYQRLMAHWVTLMPGRLIELDYEALIKDQETVSRNMITRLKLSWEPACLSFQDNPAPAATASAVQVRERIHDKSVGLWRRYEAELAPLIDCLTKEGVDLSSSQEEAF